MTILVQHGNTKTAALNLQAVLEDPGLTGAEVAIHLPFINEDLAAFCHRSIHKVHFGN
jgi:hypothetical protein